MSQKNLTLEELIEEYKKMAFICSQVDYADKQTVKNNNKAVKRMYQIVDLIKSEFGSSGISAFSKLIDCKQDRVNVWAAVQTLERLTVDFKTHQQALTIVEQEAKESLGMEYWLKNFRSGKMPGT